MIPLSFVTHADSEDAIDYTKDHTRAMKMLEDEVLLLFFARRWLVWSVSDAALALLLSADAWLFL